VREDQPCSFRASLHATIAAELAFDVTFDITEALLSDDCERSNNLAFCRHGQYVGNDYVDELYV
jgi:hypothetical protein